MKRAKDLLDKYNRGHIYGYPSDSELLELVALATQARDLARAFDAGNACVDYFQAHLNTLATTTSARGL